MEFLPSCDVINDVIYYATSLILIAYNILPDMTTHHMESVQYYAYFRLFRTVNSCALLFFMSFCYKIL